VLDVTMEWLTRNPVYSSPGCWLECGAGVHADDPLLPYGIESTGQVSLHSSCWPAWNESRRVEASAGLAAMGIVPPKVSGDGNRGSQKVGETGAEPPASSPR
jgi:hypothetical protein